MMKNATVTITKDRAKKILLAAMSMFGISAMIKSDSNLFALSNSVLSIAVFWAAYALITHVMSLRNFKGRLKIVSLVIGTIYSFFMVSGVNLLLTNSTMLNKLSTWGQIICGVVPWSLIVAELFAELIPKLVQVDFKGNLGTILVKLFNSKYSFVWLWILIFVAWLPVLFAAFPGIYGYDSIYQIAYYQTGKIVLHHPLVHTYLLGFFVVTVGDWLHNREMGLLIYTLIQMAVLSGAFAFVETFLVQKKRGVFWPTVWLLTFMFLPVNSLMAVSATKDIIYTAMFVMVEVLLVKIISQRKSNWFLYSCFVIISFLNIIFRTQGIYVFALTGLVATLTWIRQLGWKRIAFLFFLPIVMYIVYAGPITKAFHGVKTDNIGEMMSVPVVQMSRALYYGGQELTKEQKKEIIEYVPGYQAISYNSGISDAMKNTFNTPKFKKAPGQFVKLWTSVGLRQPMAYVDAFARLTIGLWYPDMNYRDPQAYHPYWEYYSWTKQSAPEGNYIFVGRHSLKGFGTLSKQLASMSYTNSYQKIGVVAMLFSSGIYSWIVILFIGWIWYKKEYSLAVPATFIVAYVLSVALGPVVMYRYIFPIAVSVPIMLHIIGTSTVRITDLDSI